MTALPVAVILGGGLAGHRAAKALRQAEFDGDIIIIDAEPVRPYDRTFLSKAFLQGTKQSGDLFFESEDEYADWEIDLLTGTRATAVDFAARRLTLDSGDTLGFDQLLIATGASPIRLRQPGFDLPGVHYLRTLADAQALQAGITGGTRVVVVGASFIGSEVAASARMLGADVTLVDPVSAPMASALGEEIGRIFAGIHQEHGVDLRMGTRVVELRGHGRVEEAVTAEGERIPCDLVVVGVGVRPETGLFAGTGLEIDNGIVVDQFCATNIPGVYAAGDVANWWHPARERRIRVEHFDNAALQGTAAGRAMAGQPEAHAPVPYFWTDQYDVNLQYAGFPGSVENIVLRGDPGTVSVTAFYLTGRQIQAVATVNQSRDLRPARQLIEAGARVDPAVLTDPKTDLRALAKQFRPAK